MVLQFLPYLDMSLMGQLILMFPFLLRDALLVILNNVVEIGPNTALATIAGNQIIGFFKMFGTCNIDVPNPCEINPLILLSRKLATANPIIFAQHPTVAAPAASPFKFNIIDIERFAFFFPYKLKFKYGKCLQISIVYRC